MLRKLCNPNGVPAQKNWVIIGGPSGLRRTHALSGDGAVRNEQRAGGLSCWKCERCRGRLKLIGTSFTTSTGMLRRSWLRNDFTS
jgi:hypothetical protein